MVCSGVRPLSTDVGGIEEVLFAELDAIVLSIAVTVKVEAVADTRALRDCALSKRRVSARAIRIAGEWEREGLPGNPNQGNKRGRKRNNNIELHLERVICQTLMWGAETGGRVRTYARTYLAVWQVLIRHAQS